MERFPETRLYGPYHHGGRSYYQWMARGTALVRDVLPLLEGRLDRRVDGYAAERFEAMCSRYAAYIARERARLEAARGVAPWPDDRDQPPSTSSPAASKIASLRSRSAGGCRRTPSPGCVGCTACSSKTRLRRPRCAIRARRSTTTWPTRWLASSSRQIRAAATLADLGSGAGVPGLPLAIALPGTSVALVDSLTRRCAFLERAVAQVEVHNARVVNTRVESWPEGLASFDVVTARALAPLPVVVEYAAPLLVRGGTLVAGAAGATEPPRTRPRAQRPRSGLEPAEDRAGSALSRRPATVTYTSCRRLWRLLAGFPRRPGMALKRPLGAR